MRTTRVSIFAIHHQADEMGERPKYPSRRLARKARDLVRSGLVLVVVTICLLSRVLVIGEETKAKNAAPTSKKAEKKNRKQLSGAELYAMHCNRCHPERYAPERTEEQWKTILLHMRTRANLPAEHAKAILKFLQDDSGK